MEQLKGVKSFLQKAAEKQGAKYDEAKADEIIKSSNYDQDKLIDNIGTRLGFKADELPKFRERAYKEFSISPIDDVNRAEIDFISKPIEPTDDISGYEKYSKLEEERSIGEQLLSNLQQQGTEKEIPIAYTGPKVPGLELKPISRKEMVYEPQIQGRITDLQERVKSINEQLAQQSDINIKETGFTSEQHKLTRDKFIAYDAMFDEAIAQRGEQAKTKYTSPVGMGAGVPTVKYRPEDVRRVRNLRDIKSMYKKIGKVLEAPQGKDFESNLKGLWHGLTQSNTARDFWTMGINEMARNLNVKDAFDKQQAGQELDQEEQALLETYTLLQNIQAGSRKNTGAIVGEGLQDMIPFILEFAMTSGTSVAAKKVVKEFVKNRVKNATLAKVAGGITKVGTQAAIMPTTAKGYAERIAPTIEEGELVPGEAPEEAMLKSYLTTAAEVIGEDAAIMGARALRKKAIQRLANNPTKSQEFLAKIVTMVSAETGVPTVQGVPFELVSEEITGALQAIIDDDGSFFTPEAQWQLFLMTSLAGGGAVAFSAPRRIGVKKRYNESVEGLNDIPNANYTESVNRATENITDPEELAKTFDQISKEFKGKISEEDYYKARNFIGNSIRYNQMSTARNVQIEKGIAEFKDDNGNVSTAEIDGQQWYIRNPQDIGTGKIILGKNDAGEVKAFPNQKVKEAFTQTPDEVKADIDQEDEFLEKEQERIDAIQQDAADRGIEVNKTIVGPHGKGTVISINEDGTVTVADTKGDTMQVQINEVEPYKTTEQKDAEKAEVKREEDVRETVMEGIEEGAEIESDETQDLPDETKLRVINFDNGQSKIITAEGEQVFNTTEERDIALKTIVEGKIAETEATIDEMAPEERFEQLRLQDEEIASEMFTEEIKAVRTQAKEIRNKKTESPQERFNNLTQAKELEAEAQRLEAILNEPRKQRLVNEAETLFLELESEQENTPYNQLDEWQQDLLNRDFNIDSFIRYGDRNEIDNELKRAWIAPKKDKDLSSKNIDAAAIELSEIANREITPQDIVDFILANRKKDVPKTTGRMNEIRVEYKALTGKSINNHEAFKEEIGLEPEKLAAKAETPEEQAYEEGIAKLKEAGYTDEQIARLTEGVKPPVIPTTAEATKELFGEPAVAEVPFRTKKKPDDKKDITRAPGAIEEREAIERPEPVKEKGREEIEADRVLEKEGFLNISETAAEDLKDKQNAQRAMIDISNELKQKANIIHSTEIPEEVREQEKGLAPGKEGTAFFHNGEMYIVSDRITSVSDSKKSYLHELIVHKGLRELFEQGDQTIIGKQFAKFNDLMIDVYGSMNQMDRLNTAKTYFPDAYKQYFDKNGKEIKAVPVNMQSFIAEEFMAELSEQEKIPSKWQEFVDRLTRLISKTFNLTSRQFTQTDLLNIIREQRERFGKVTDTKLTKADNILAEEAKKVPEIKEEVVEEEIVEEIKEPVSLQKEKPTSESDLQKIKLEGDIVRFRTDDKLTPDGDNLLESAGLKLIDDIKTREDIADYNARIEILNKLYENNMLKEDHTYEIEEDYTIQAYGDMRTFEEIKEEKIDELDEDLDESFESEEEKPIDYLDELDFAASNMSIEDLVRQAKGTTDYIELAGYIMQDGDLLDFSGGQGARYEDHRQLGIPYKEQIQSPTESMERFKNTTGAIRTDGDKGSIDINTPPTNAQRSIISKIIRKNINNYNIDLSDGERTLSISDAPLEFAIQKIDDFYEDETIGTGVAESIRFRQQQAREETETDPSEAQIKAGNYKKGTLRFDGFDISIENPKGSIRSGIDKTGKEWSREMPADYGYFKGTIGRDKDHIDVFMGENLESDKVYVIDQIDPSTGKFDEHKIMMGFDNVSSARNTYNSAYEEGWTGLGQITRTNKEGLKEWFKGDTKKPYSDITRFRITEKTTDPEIAALFEKLEKLRKVSKPVVKVKELEAEKKAAIIFEKPEIEKQIKDFKEGVKAGKKYSEERIDTIQQAIIDYAKANMPLDEAGIRDVGSILTALKKARTPVTIAKAFEKIDELTGKVTAKTKRRKEEKNIKRVLKWMTTYKKQGATKAGKFQYEDVKQFDELKNIDKEVTKLSKVVRSNKSTDTEKDAANASIEVIWNELNEKENKNLLDETVLKLIELRRNGAGASDALVTAINEDLQTIYNAAKEAKTDEDIERAITRKDDREFIKGFVEDKRLEDQSWIKQADTKLNNFTANVMGNWETLMTMLGGTNARNKFSLIIDQVNQEMGIQGSFNKVLDEAMKGYGFKTKNQMLKHIQELKKEEYTLVKPIRGRERGEGADMNISKMHIIDIHNAIKNKDIRNDMYMAYGDIVVDEEGVYDREAQKAIGKKRINALTSELNEGDKVFAESMQKQVDAYYNSTNEVFVKMFNRDLPKVENYWMSTAEFKSEKDVFNQFMQDAKHPSAVKERAGRRSPKVADAFDKFSKHVKHSEWYKNMAIPIDEINRVFSDLNVADLISESRGKGFYQTITKSIENQGLQPATRDLTDFERIGGNILGNWVSAKIGMTPSVPFKQLTSVVNYAENMPPHEWLLGFLKGLANPKATFDYMWENVPYLKDRFEKGYSEALEYAMNAASGLPKAKNWQQAIKNFQTIGTRSGDIAAIMFGGKPYIDYLIKTKGMSQEEAVEQFLLDTLRSQQAPFSSTLSIYQNSRNPFAKALFTFANTPSQYMRKMFEANQSYRHGDISKTQLAKIYAIYGVANQFLYIGAGALIAALMRGSDPGEDLWKKALAQGITSLVGGIPLIRDIAQSTSKQALGLHVYDDALPVMEELGKLSEYSVKAIKGEGDVPKHLKEVAKLTLELGGLSTANAEKLWKATVKRGGTFAITRGKETDRTLTKLAAPKKTMDEELAQGNQSKFYLNYQRSKPEYKEAEAANNLKSAYSSAKRDATKLTKEGKEAKAERLLELIESSKTDLSQTDYSYSDVESELRQFNRLVKIYSK